LWDEEAGEYSMLIAARLTTGPSRRRGITGLCTSPDLKHWTVRAPFYAPHLYFTHECPDLFRLGDWWYLLFSEFSDTCVTRYRLAKSLAGPWLTPPVDTFDGRAFYAAKTAAPPAPGAPRFLFGWNPTRAGEKDYAPWQWGGNLVVHEIVQEDDGALAVRLPPTIAGAFGPPEAAAFTHGFGPWSVEAHSLRLPAQGRFTCASAGELPPTCLIQASLHVEPGAEACGIMLRTDPTFETGYYVRLEPQRRRLVFDAWPRAGDMPHMVELERPLTVSDEQPVQLTLYVNGSLCEVYVDGRIALSARLYDHAAGAWGIFAQNGAVEATGVTVSLLQNAPSPAAQSA
jgi:beta-fructofuranosidase